MKVKKEQCWEICKALCVHQIMFACDIHRELQAGKNVVPVGRTLQESGAEVT